MLQMSEILSSYHARFCFLDTKCVRYDEATHSFSYPRKNAPKTENNPRPTCTNCSEEHPASYRGCKKFPYKIPKKSYANAVQNKNNSDNTDTVEKISKPQILIPTERLRHPFTRTMNVVTMLSNFSKY